MYLSWSKHELTCEFAMHVGSIVEYSIVLLCMYNIFCHDTLNWITTASCELIKTLCRWILHIAITLAAQRYLNREYRIIGTY